MSLCACAPDHESDSREKYRIKIIKEIVKNAHFASIYLILLVSLKKFFFLKQRTVSFYTNYLYGEKAGNSELCFHSACHVTSPTDGCFAFVSRRQYRKQKINHF